jgi:hypothetical protein
MACGSGGQEKPAQVATVQQPVTRDDSAERERARHDELAAAHRKLEEEQQSALAATCSEADRGEKHERCLPSCYPTEPADPRAGKKLTGAVEVTHVVCEQAGQGDAPAQYVIADEIERAKLVARPGRGRPPAPHRKGSWQQTVASAFGGARGPVVIVTSGWRNLEHPLTKEKLRCVTAAFHLRGVRRPLDGCGGDGGAACEATGDNAARAINVVHYRVAEARRLQAAGKTDECQQAALEAVAVARGLPRWRQYVKLNIGKWVDRAAYRTRFDGTLDEDALFARTASLGAEAEGIYTACGGPAGAPTVATQEQSFHTCW